MSDKLLSTIQKTFSLYGYYISRDNCKFLSRQLQAVSESEHEDWIVRIAEQILTQNLTNPNISTDNIKQALKECVLPSSTLRDTETIFNVLQVEDIPRVTYDTNKKKFVLEKVKFDPFPDAKYKTQIFNGRLELVYHRTLRHELFAPVKFSEKNTKKIQLTPIEFLLSDCKQGTVYVMGFISRLTEGQLYLEDRGGAIKLELRKTTFQSGFFMEGSIAIVNGNYRDGTLYAKDIAFPPPELSDHSRAIFGDANTFGGDHPTSLKMSSKLRIHETAHPGEIIVFLSEVWLDNPIVLKKLRVMFDGYMESPPTAFVLLGHFLSFPPNSTSLQKLTEGLKNLANIIRHRPSIQKYSKFVFVPGPEDLGAPKILPRASLPQCVMEDFLKVVPGTILASNPCRIQYCTKEIVVFREDMLIKLSRNTIKLPTEGDVYDHYVKSVICQSHLAPLSLPIIPVYWNYDHALQLYPLPDLIVVADRYEAYKTKFADCHFINPGSFPLNEYSFKAYIPASNEIEQCAIPNTDDMGDEF